MVWFDESRLDDERALASIDLRLRSLAESGARVRRERVGAAEATAVAVARMQDNSRPRALIAAGADSRLLRAVLEPWCPVPFVAWTGPALPGWAGSLDLVVVLAADGGDPGTASVVAEAVRRGCQVVVSGPPASLVGEHAAGRWSTILPTSTGDPLAAAVVALEFLEQVGLGPRVEADAVAQALDQMAIDCSPLRDVATNPAKVTAIAMADASPVVWGGSVLAARAARRVAESIRRATGRSALAGDVEALLPVIEAARPHDVFDDPFSEPGSDRRPVLLLLDDGSVEPAGRAQRERLLTAAEQRGVRVEHLVVQEGSEVARYASLVLWGSYAADYLRLALVDG